MSDDATSRQRLDVWLWHARFFKTRSLSTKMVRARKVRVDGTPVTKANTLIGPGMVLTFQQANTIRIVKIIGLSDRRGPAPEAQSLYEDLTPPPEPKEVITRTATAPRDKGAGRPTKTERRALEKLRPELKRD